MLTDVEEGRGCEPDATGTQELLGGGGCLSSVLVISGFSQYLEQYLAPVRCSVDIC